MPHHVLGNMFHVVDPLGGVCMPDEFRIQIPRMIRLPQRETKIVHGEDVFQQLGIVVIADAAGRP